jgi:hypothetical protein
MAMTMGDISKMRKHAAFPREYIMLNVVSRPDRIIAAVLV